MRPNTLWKILSVVFVILFVSLFAQNYFYSAFLKNYLFTNKQEAALQQLKTLSYIIKGFYPESWDRNSLTQWLHQYYQSPDYSLSIINSQGHLMADSVLETQQLESVASQSNTPEFMQAKLKGHGHTIRYVEEYHREVFIVSMAMEKMAILRISFPITSIEAPAKQLIKYTYMTLLLSSIIILLMALILVKNWNQWFGAMQTAIDSVSEGKEPPFLFRAILKNKLFNRFMDASSLVRNQRRVLEEELLQLNSILTAMLDGVLVTDLDGKVILDNAALHTLLGEPKTFVGNSVLECIRNKEIYTSIQQVMQDASAEEIQIQIQGEGKQKDILVHTTPLLKAAEMVGAVSVFYNITEVKKLENIRREFVANVSHELKTPLTNIRGYAETLRNVKIEDTAIFQKFLAKIEDNAKNLQNLVEDVLMLSAIESGRISYHFEHVEIEPLLKEIVADFSRVAEQKQQRITCTVEVIDSLVELDIRSFKQIIGNLIDNAIKYTPEDGKIEIIASQEEGFLKIQIKDNGPGISSENLSRIFERFFRVDKAHSKTELGTGLGLAIVKHLLVEYDGKIDVESTMGMGTTFSIWIPLRQLRRVIA